MTEFRNESLKDDFTPAARRRGPSYATVALSTMSFLLISWCGICGFATEWFGTRDRLPDINQAFENTKKWAGAGALASLGLVATYYLGDRRRRAPPALPAPDPKT